MSDINKFTWKKGDVTIEYSQCKDCGNNEDIGKCLEYGRKPQQYSGNDEKCPQYTKK